jgi:hypothetical protein
MDAFDTKIMDGFFKCPRLLAKKMYKKFVATCRGGT